MKICSHNFNRTLLNVWKLGKLGMWGTFCMLFQEICMKISHYFKQQLKQKNYNHLMNKVIFVKDPKEVEFHQSLKFYYDSFHNAGSSIIAPFHLMTQQFWNKTQKKSIMKKFQDGIHMMLLSKDVLNFLGVPKLCH